MTNAINTFLGVLFVVMVVIGVTSNGALKGSDAFALRWTVISLAVAFSAAVGWLRWRIGAHREVSWQPGEQTDAAHRSPSPVDRSSPLPVVRDRSPQIAAAARQAIVFRQHFPPRHEPGTLSFFGGAPVAPRGFRWPRPSGDANRSKPFSFLMQLDCAAVPATARLGMLPDRGVLYFFLDLTWGNADAFRVLYEEGQGKDWIAIQPPDDLEPAFGDQAPYVWRWTQSVQECPQLLPRWTFQPVVIDVPTESDDRDGHEEEDANGPSLWPGEKRTAEALRAAQGDEVLSRSFTAADVISADGALRRPFANYPHDWRALQICSGLVLHHVRDARHLPGMWALRELSDSDRDALVIRIRDEAGAWFNRAVAHPPFAAVPQADSDSFWSWLTDKPWLVRFVIGDALTMSIEGVAR